MVTKIDINMNLERGYSLTICVNLSLIVNPLTVKMFNSEAHVFLCPIHKPTEEYD